MSASRAGLFALLFLALITPGLLLAQAPEPAPAQEKDAAAIFAAEADELIKRVDFLLADIARLEPQLESAQGEYKLILNRRVVSKKLEALAKANALAEAVAEREEAGGDASAERAHAADFLTRATPLIQQHVLGVEQHLASIAEDPTPLSGAERSDLERKIQLENGRVSSSYQQLLDNAEHLDLLGLDSQAPRATLEARLPDRAENLVARIELAKNETRALKLQLKNKKDDGELQSKVVAAEQRLKNSTIELTETIRLLKQAGLKAAAFQTVLVEETGEITKETFDKDVAVGLVKQWWERIRKWITKDGPGWLVRPFFILLILLITRFLARLARRLVARASRAPRFNLSRLLQRMISNVASQSVWIVGILVALSQLGISLTPLLAGLGIAGFIVGFALQDTLSNFASGMMILLYRPYDVGDAVEVGGVFGKVDQMSLVATTILTLDNQTLVVPNSKIWGDVIKNVTAQTSRRIDMTFGISYQDDIPKAEKLFEEILRCHDKVLEDPEPIVRLHNLGESSVDFVVRPWVDTADYWEVYWDVTRAVKIRCDEEGISIPFPQRDVHHYNTSPAPETTSGAG